MHMQFKAKEKGEQPKMFTQLPHRYKHFTKHPLEKHPKKCFFLGNDSNFDKRFAPVLFAPLENGYEPFYKGGAFI